MSVYSCNPALPQTQLSNGNTSSSSSFFLVPAPQSQIHSDPSLHHTQVGQSQQRLAHVVSNVLAIITVFSSSFNLSQHLLSRQPRLLDPPCQVRCAFQSTFSLPLFPSLLILSIPSTISPIAPKANAGSRSLSLTPKWYRKGTKFAFPSTILDVRRSSNVFRPKPSVQAK